MQMTAAFEEAQLLLIEGKDREAAEAFTKAINEGADPYVAHLSRGAAYLKLREADKAIGDFNEAVKARSNNARPYYYRGMAYMVANRYDQAVADFSRAIELEPGHPQAKLGRALSLARLDRGDEATKDLRDAINEMEAKGQEFVDQYGIVRTEMWNVMMRASGEAEMPSLNLTDEEIETLKKWLSEMESPAR